MTGPTTTANPTGTGDGISSGTTFTPWFTDAGMTQLSSANDISTFNLTSPAAMGTVDNTAHTVLLKVPFGTDFTTLAPTIEVSPGATVVPVSGAAGDFTAPQTYTVTSADGTAQDYTVTIDVAPDAPVITTPSQVASSTALTIVGTAQAGSTVDIIGGAAPASDIAAGDGSYAIPVTLTADMVNTLSVTATNAAGNMSAASTVSITEDETAPTGTIEINGGASYTNDQNVTLTLTPDADLSGVSQVGLSNGGAYTWESYSSPTVPWSLSNSGDGLKHVYVKFRDTAGNATASGIGAQITLDTLAPTVSEVTPVSTLNDATPDYVYNTTEAGTVAYGGDCSSTPGGAVNVGDNTVTFSTLADGPHLDCTITVTDSAGNPSNTLTVSSFTTDTMPPTVIVTTDSISGKVKSGDSVTVTATYGEDVLDAPAPTITTSGAVTDGPTPMTMSDATHYTYTYVAADGDGPVTFSVAGAVDLSGNAQAGPETVALTLDNTPPMITVPSDITQEATSLGGAVVDYIAPMAEDAADGAFAATCDHNPGDTFPLGITPVTCNATDTAGNAAIAATFSVTVQDTTPPAIAPHDNMTDEATSPAGATVGYASPSTEDLVDGVGVSSCAPESGSQFTLGDTTVTCSATDAAGNGAIPTEFTVSVVDTTAPSIELSGTVPDVEIHTPYTELGATATDIVDGPFAATPSGDVNTNAVGSYTITYTATDVAGNSATMTRTVNVVDSVANAFGVISAALAAPGTDIANNLNEVTTDNVSVFDGLAHTGLYFEKSVDGTPVGRLAFANPLDLSDMATQVFLQDLGAKLEQGNGRVAFDARTSEVFAATGASITMYGLPPSITEGKLIVRDDLGNILTGATAGVSGFSQDPVTGNVTFDAAHFTQFDIDTAAPSFGPSPSDTIGTTGETATVQITANDNISVAGAEISVNDGAFMAMTETSASISRNTPSQRRYIYNIELPLDSTAQVLYRVKIIDSAGNSTDSGLHAIAVTDNDSPLIGLIGDNPQVIEMGTPYVELGATVTDNVDSGLVATDDHSAVNTAVIGSYSVSYTAVDASGNHADLVTRAITVADTTSRAPADITVGSPTLTTLALSWTNNELNGGYYVIKRSSTPITTDAEFAAAATLGGAPIVASGAQGYTAKNLSAGTTYYFAIKMIDAVGNVSPMSTASGTTVSAGAPAPSDTAAPAAVSDLRLSAGTTPTSQIVLNWSATGDDGSMGMATKYIVKRASAEITADNWSAATTIFNSLSPKSSGSAETLTVSGLTSGVQYCFAVEVQDEVPNTSVGSNSVCLTTSSNVPTVTTVTPATGQNDGAVGIIVSGTGFTSNPVTVRLTNASNTFDLTGNVSGGSVQATVPVGAPVGVYKVKVTNSDGTSVLTDSTPTYTVTAAPVPLPSVTDVLPSNIGTNDSNVSVEIYGTSFTGATGAVLDDGPATHLTNFTVVSATKITAAIPGTLAAGTYNVKVTTPSGTNTISSVKITVNAPVVINTTTTQDQTTDKPIDLGDTNTIPVQITMQSNTDTSTIDDKTTIEVVIPPATDLTTVNDTGDIVPYTGNINPPQIVKPTEAIASQAGADAVVITMGNPEERISFSNDFVTTVTLVTSRTTAPIIWYYNPTSGLEIAGKGGTKDGVTYTKGGTVLNTVSNGDGTYTYTIGLLLDHMSSYVAGVTPTVTAMSTTEGSAGILFTITGTNFSPGVMVDFGSNAVTVSSSNTTSISASVPSITLGSYTVRVTNSDALSNIFGTQFSVTSAPTPTPSNGGGGGPTGLIGSVNATVSASASASQGQVLGATVYNFTKNLSLGSRGADVTALQEVLIADGFLKTNATGYFGAMTKAAVLAYQRFNQLPAVGTVGPMTRAILNKGTTSVANNEALIQQLQAQITALQAQIQVLIAKQKATGATQ